ncbi:hypothetical protein CONCODRAFT_77542 [Conidiobolus coronatus NRRL 28638]|uniref:Uncharacterized protein n=1 Tax=Conidiobolus coronatus (strain ATCC 28846 / CBS 209.66 / NRRL 28638) TaxID=796925 RepID=A0A137PDG8_CONC2|nr:hypothetical protein CONCODRAFT_77542 [Conidiobolus coronatus NRRL 28638]|eukprot:KXN73012.1 hypothetical protein CONCODRAFT_77542 [Conidiobolus coronatus NRRL 28638]
MLKSPDTVQFIDDNNGSDRERDNDSLASDIESEQEEEEQTDKYAKIQEEKAAEQASLLNQRTSGRQTGVKGVISDYRYLRKLEKSNSSNSQMSSGSGISSGQLDSLNQMENSFNNLELDELEDNLSDDEAFFEQYKQKRLEELRKNQRSEQIGASKNELNQAIFNKVYELNEDNYIKVIDEQSPKTHVIIHLYQRVSMSAY